MTENQLKLNDDKTEALLFPFLSSLKPSTVSLPDSITLGPHNIPFSDSARNLEFILFTSYILSRLDYCNCLLMGTPNSVIQPLQKIQNCAARLVLLAPCHHHSTPTLHMKMNRYIYGHIHK